MLNDKISRLVLSTLLCSLGVTAVVNPSLAQNQSQNAIDSSLRPNEPGATISGSNNGLNMFDLIMRSQLAPTRNAQEVADQQRQSLDSGTEAFRRQQLELLRRQDSKPEATITPTVPTQN